MRLILYVQSLWLSFTDSLMCRLVFVCLCVFALVSTSVTDTLISHNYPSEESLNKFAYVAVSMWCLITMTDRQKHS